MKMSRIGLVLAVVIVFSFTLAGLAWSGINDGLVTNYTFSGNANDTSGTGNDGFVSGATLISDRVCSDQNAYSFNGSTDYIEKTNPVSLDLGSYSWTISAWVNRSAAGDGTIVSRYECGWGSGSSGPTSAAAYLLHITSNGTVTFIIRDDTDTTYSVDSGTAFSIQNGKWYHIVGVLDRDASALQLYINGEMINSTSVNGISTLTDRGSPLEIGRLYREGWGVPTDYFAGMIDDVRIYNRAISDCEVGQLYYKVNN